MIKNTKQRYDAYFHEIQEICHEHGIVVLREMTTLGTGRADQWDRVALYTPDYSRTIYLNGRFYEKCVIGEPELVIGLFTLPMMSSGVVTHNGQPLVMSTIQGEQEFPAIFNDFVKEYAGVEELKTKLPSLAERMKAEEKLEPIPVRTRWLKPSRG